MADDPRASAIFGSDAFARVMSTLTDRPGEPLTAGELERLSGVRSRDSLYRAIGRGIRGGLVLRRGLGRGGAYEVNTGSPLYPEMKALLSKLTGVAAAVHDVLSHQAGVKAAFLYGSAAAGSDTMASDIDLLVTGEVDEEALVAELRGVEVRLGREVNALVLSPDQLRRRMDTGDPFLRDVWRKPRVMLVGDEANLPRLSVDEPGPYFHQEMAVAGTGRTWSTTVVAAVPGTQDEVTERALDVVERWIGTIAPGARAQRATPQVGWWQVVREGQSAATWQAWLYPGPVISVREPTPAIEQAPGEAAIVVPEVVRLWSTRLASMMAIMDELACDTVRAGLTVNTYGSGGEPHLVDLDFADVVRPARGAPPGMAPPWSFAIPPSRSGAALSEAVLAAARSLMRHYSYRHLDDSIRSLAAILRAEADR